MVSSSFQAVHILGRLACKNLRTEEQQKQNQQIEL